MIIVDVYYSDERLDRSTSVDEIILQDDFLQLCSLYIYVQIQELCNLFDILT